MNAAVSDSEPHALAIEIIDVGKAYKDTVALRGVNLDIEPGEFVVLLGPSGSGKSTLLKIIAGLEDATEGEIYINGRLVNYLRPKDRDVAMVFQNYALYPHMTVAANLGFPLKMRVKHKAEIEPRVREVAHFLDLDAKLDSYPDELSGGQRQRVALGRAIIREPVAFLMDEPLSNLDAQLRVQMRTELLKLHRRIGRTTIYVTHDQIEAMTMADRIVILRDGIVQQVGTTSQIYSRPANTFVATFVGSPGMNLIQGTLATVSGERVFQGPSSGLGALGAIETPDGPISVGIRPEDIEIAPSGTSDTIAATVDLVEEVGSDAYLSVTAGTAMNLIVRTPADTAVREGEHVQLRFPPGRIRVFDSEGNRVALQRDPVEVGR
jgi:multiple sugar transport system ATP-binding protein